ncbi:peptidyl-tRNA hydrolase mitochondrial [Phtheirospermum japonicum]|uniref:Peptidyl-tRNA hydrolase mitochondrial n=1 Tax=Phtheirospermum japonicum TaxID=374723 RepID=A0A830CLZ0_9LAMI|nr:peptidyl-tRNA hydrolase mitochondrial [Phtheirospermum japonicum]
MLLSRLSKRCFCTATAFSNPRPWLIVGLGNPGDKFTGTRHNVGFELIDAFAKSQGILMDSVHCKAIFGKGQSHTCMVHGVPVFLAKPQTYMNLSGESSGPLAAYYKLPLNRVLVLHDDMDLPCGVLRLNSLGNHGRHNGLKSVIYHFRQNREFPRLRIGIGRPPGQMDPKAFLLQKFNARARERIDDALQEGVEALKQVMTKGLTESSRCFNRDQKYKHIKVQTMPV